MKKITTNTSGEVIGGGIITSNGIVALNAMDETAIKIDNSDEFINSESFDTTVSATAGSTTESISIVSINYGRVVKCDLLNIRESPDLDATILGVIDKLATIEILDDSNDKFYKVAVIFNDGTDIINGYCMKKYVGLI